MPLAGLLSRNTAGEFVYRQPGNWPSYIKNMRASAYQLLFDEPHLVSWRVENLQHTPLIKLTGTINFVVIARDGDHGVLQLKELAGHPVCAQAPPLMDSLILFSQFPNPSRQPQHRRVVGAQAGYRELISGRCRGAVLPLKLYEELSRTQRETHVLFLSNTLPNWALSADSRISPDLQRQIQAVMLDPANSDVTRRLNNIFSVSNELKTVDPAEYAGHSLLLRDFWGLQ